LDEMAVEPRVAGFEPIGFLTPAAQRDEQHVAAPGLLTNFSSRLVSVQLRHAYVEQRDIRVKLCGNLERLEAVVCRARLVAQQIQQYRESSCGVLIVIDHQDALV